ncbi:uncharacterized protein MONBRDRAFT_34339 [Monosiga brevicollis MX1]|uniref:Transcription factor CBF/NF-Y/archaeal histone domain-containing protein n=1 Tax=Monosiga brevicollis TaxID=81824 RepID=A9VB19_MONBE|nr:uncharacterized protein MONBRDRAFT_34339 [Monosiga brevicollis MX1]EDQ85315.1 predicted protein [Monosiga brevicollis MX1]|eukprot:XP_001749936.1 hypothetical protein [Monosiga brevicollis MX1]
MRMPPRSQARKTAAASKAGAKAQDVKTKAKAKIEKKDADPVKGSRAKKLPVPSAKAEARFRSTMVKKIMQSDEEVGRVAAPAADLLSRLVDVFADELVRAGVEQCHGDTLSAGHLKQVIMAHEEYDFLQELASKYKDPVNKKTKTSTARSTAAASSRRRSAQANEQGAGPASKRAKTAASSKKQARAQKPAQNSVEQSDPTEASPSPAIQQPVLELDTDDYD